LGGSHLCSDEIIQNEGFPAYPARSVTTSSFSAKSRLVHKNQLLYNSFVSLGSGWVL
jgi:hypothetical protein